MTTKHTPGPWRIVTRNANRTFNEISIRPEKSVGFGLLNTSPVCRVVWYSDLGMANARLIAAAPDLLEFVQEVRRTGDARLASMAIAVIAKATGGSQ